MTIFFILVAIIAIIVWRISSAVKPKDDLMSAIMSGKDYPHAMVFKSAETDRFYIADRKLNDLDKLLFTGTKYQCENWVNQQKK